MIVPDGSLVTLDTMILIWGGIREVVSSIAAPQASDPQMEQRARILIKDLEEAKAKIVIPAIIVGELMCQIPPEQHGTFAAVVSQKFFCPSYDLSSTALAARLWQQHRSLPASEQTKRSVLKTDVMIIAIARTAGVRFFYTHDAKARKLARNAGLTACDLPTHSQNLFTQAEENLKTVRLFPGTTDQSSS